MVNLCVDIIHFNYLTGRGVWVADALLSEGANWYLKPK